MRKVLSRPGFRWLFAGLCFSMTAESVLLLALAIWVKDLTKSDGMAGATLFAVIAPMTLAPIVGFFIDRFRRKPFLVWTLLASAGLLVPLFFVHTRADVWIIYAVAVGYGLSIIAVGGALNGLIKEVVPEDLLAEANGALQTVKQGLRLVAPLAGAGLYVATKGWGLALVTLIGFLLAALVISFLRVREERPARSEAHWSREVGAGVRHIYQTASLRRAVIGVTAAILVVGFIESAAFALVDKGLHRPPAFLSVILSLQGIGGIIGGLTAAYVVKRVGEISSIALGMVLFLPFNIAAIVPSIWLLMLLAIPVGVALPYLIVGLMTLIQRSTPNEILGRVSTAVDALLSGPQAVSIGVGAVLVGIISYKLLFAAVVVVIGLSAVYLFAGRKLSTGSPSSDETVGDGAAIGQPEVVG
jgi:MFS family permease